MKSNILKIGNAQAFWGDSIDAPALLMAQQTDLDYLTLDYLAEVSLSILALQKQKDPALGYARDFIDVIRSLIPFWKKGSKVHVISNAGGLYPEGCARACLETLRQEGCAHLKVAIVSGDDVLPVIKQNHLEPLFNNLETGHAVTGVLNKLVTANAYLGAQPIVEALDLGADIIITGRVADPSLTVAPCIAHFGWSWDDYDRIANATVAGHLIECGTQVTGGISTDWLQVPDVNHIGFPVIEMNEDSSFIVTKPADTGGIVNMQSVKEQLLYEIGDPASYLSPDITASFLSISLKEVGQNRVAVMGAKGRSSTTSYKVSATYRDGFKAHGMLTIFGRHAVKKARLCGEKVLQRVRESGYSLENSLVECLGTGASIPGFVHEIPESQYIEMVLRISVADSRREAVERFSKELVSLVTSGPQGVTGYAAGRPKVQPVFGYWPCLIEKKHVNPQVKILEGTHANA